MTTWTQDPIPGLEYLEPEPGPKIYVLSPDEIHRQITCYFL